MAKNNKPPVICKCGRKVTANTLKQHIALKCTLSNSDKLIKMVDKNIQNDIIKQSIAEELGYRLWIFWDLDEDKWPEILESFICEN